MNYYVTEIDTKSTEEWYTLITEDKEKAIRSAQDAQYQIERDKKKNHVVEIRMYVEDIEDDNCDCFDYNLLDF